MHGQQNVKKWHLDRFLFLITPVFPVSFHHCALESAICRNPQKPSKLDSRIAEQFGYRHTFCQNVVHTKKFLVLTFSEKHNLLECWSVEDRSGSFCLL
jgi:hypothetical protein